MVRHTVRRGRRAVRALVLSALLVTSVVAGGVAFAGTTAAQATEEPTIEDLAIANEENGLTLEANDNGRTIQGHDLTLTTNLDAGERKSFTLDISEARDAGLTPHWVLETNDSNVEVWNLTVDGDAVTFDLVETAGEAQTDATPSIYPFWNVTEVTNDGRVVYEVSTADGEVIDRATFKVVGEYSKLVQPGDELDVYAGETVQFRNNGTKHTQVTVYSQDDDGSMDQRVAALNTTISDRINYDTSTLDVGETYTVAFEHSNDTVAGTSTMVVRNLGLSVTTENSTVTRDERIVAGLTTADPGGAYTAELREVDGDVVNATAGEFGATGDATVRFPPPPGPGNYTVAVQHEESGFVAETDDIRAVCGCGEVLAFGSDGYFGDTVGDDVAIPVELTETDSAEVRIGSEDDGYWINATVVDADDDGEALLEFDSQAAGTNETNEVLTTVHEGDSIRFEGNQGEYGTDTDGASDGNPDAASLASGQYALSLESTWGSDVGTLDLRDASEADADFGGGAYFESIAGPVVEIPIELSNTDTADVRIGSEDAPYWVNGTVEDAGDGTVTLLFDTTAAGTNGTDDVLTVDDAAESDEVFVHGEGGISREANGTDADDAPIPATEYGLLVETTSGSDDIGTLSLADPSTVDANFTADAFFRDEAGSVMRIPIELSNTDTATVRIGSEDLGYWINGTVEDAGDGTVTLLVDTGAAGSADAVDVLTVATDAENDSIGDVSEGGELVANGSDGDRSGLFDAGEYDLAVATEFGGDDVGTLSLYAPSEDLPEPVVDGTVPVDPDDDGLYEDVDGDGATDLEDLVHLYQHRDEPRVTDYTDAYDFSGNDAIDLADVVQLFLEVTAD